MYPTIYYVFTFLVTTIDWLGVSYMSQIHVDNSKTISIIREEDVVVVHDATNTNSKEYKFSIGGPKVYGAQLYWYYPPRI